MTTNPDSNEQIPSSSAEPVKPADRWNTVLSMTPVVLTVLATIFAGMSSSEMTRSMYFRALAAQEQSKAGDEWAFFQTKRIRGTNMETMAQLLESLTHPPMFEASEFSETCDSLLSRLSETTGPINREELRAKVQSAKSQFKQLLAEPESKQGLELLISNKLPKVESGSISSAQTSIDSVVKAIGQRKSEEETADQVRQLREADVQEATKAAQRAADSIDKITAPATNVAERVRKLLDDLETVMRSLRRSKTDKSEYAGEVRQFDDLKDGFKLAAMNFDAARYRREASYNRRIAEMFEVQVRCAGIESDRHRDRSRNFFYSMLAAQAGVTVASLALSKERKSGLWLFAALAGLCALLFSAYVYFSM